MEERVVQILVGVAMIQLETLKTDVEQGSMGRAFRHGSTGPKCWVYSDVNWAHQVTLLRHSTKGKEVEIPPSRCAMLFAVFGNKRKLGYSRVWSRKRCLFFFTSLIPCASGASVTYTLETAWLEKALEGWESMLTFCKLACREP